MGVLDIIFCDFVFTLSHIRLKLFYVNQKFIQRKTNFLSISYIHLLKSMNKIHPRFLYYRTPTERDNYPTNCTSPLPPRSEQSTELEHYIHGKSYIPSEC